MSKYKGLFTFDDDNHRYVPVEQADGIISDMDYRPESEEEPKEYWTIDWTSLGVAETGYSGDAVDDFNKSIGNYFETKAEAELTLRKLKAWRWLKDTGCEPITWKWKQDYPNDACYVEVVLKCKFDAGVNDRELDLLFRGEE